MKHISVISILLWLLLQPFQEAFSLDFTSKDNYTGIWTYGSSWTGGVAPSIDINGNIITINGFITVTGDLTSSGTMSKLIINDTLEVQGNLNLDNNTDIIINTGGILIVRGNVTLKNQVNVGANSYFIIGGNFTKDQPQGSFTSILSPSKVFITGAITGVDPSDPDFSVFDCTSPPVYANSGCNYGNSTDLSLDPVYFFYQTTCPVKPSISLGENPVVCGGSTSANLAYTSKSIDADTYGLDFNAAAEAQGFIDIPFTTTLPASTVIITVPASAVKGTYYGNLRVKNSISGCYSVAYQFSVTVSALPGAAGTISGPVSVCQGSEGNVFTIAAVTGAGGYMWTLPSGASITSGDNTPSVTISFSETAVAGSIKVKATGVCGDGAESPAFSLTVSDRPNGSLAGSTYCKEGPGSLTWTASSGTAPFTIVYNDGTADRTATGVLSGVPFTADPSPVTSTTTYTLKSVTDANSCTRTSGFTSGTAIIKINPLPQGSISSNGPLCGPGTGKLKFSASSGTGPFSIVYNDGTADRSVNGINSGDWIETAVNPLTVTTVFTLKKITDASLCERTGDFEGTTATINIKPVPSVTSSSNISLCSGSQLNYDITSEVAGSLFLWSRAAVAGIDNAAVEAQTADPVTEVLVNSTDAPLNVVYRINAVADGCTGPEFIYTVTVNNKPRLFVNSPDPVCRPASVDITSSAIYTGSTSGLVYSFWTDSAATLPYETPQQTIFGKYFIKGTSAEGCSDVKAVNVTVHESPVVRITDPDPVCSPARVNITEERIVSGSSPGLTYSFWLDDQSSVEFANPSEALSGVYYIKGVDSNGCDDIKPVTVKVNPLTSVLITSSDEVLCLSDTRVVTVSPSGGALKVEEGPGILSDNLLSATGSGTIRLIYTYTDVCSNSASQTIQVNEKPVADAGPDQRLAFIFETEMGAQLQDKQTGEWSLVSGSGKFTDIASPVTEITGLGIGENIFRWNIKSGLCEDYAEVRVFVSDLFVPDVITPNGDGKNDFFRINALENQDFGRVELLVLNKWNVVVYRNSDYRNDWDGKTDSGDDLENDTYMYLIRFDSGFIKKGTVLIIR